MIIATGLCFPNPGGVVLFFFYKHLPLDFRAGGVFSVGKSLMKQNQVSVKKEALTLIACVGGCGMFILEDGEVFGDQSKGEDTCGEDADGD